MTTLIYIAIISNIDCVLIFVGLEYTLILLRQLQIGPTEKEQLKSTSRFFIIAIVLHVMIKNDILQPK